MAQDGFSGMAELIADLGRMGESVHTDAAGIVRASADLMEAELMQNYPSKSGTLRDRVVTEELGPLRVRVRNKAPHAHLYEFGTTQRFTAGRGANRGTMPANPTFIPAAIRARRRMREELIGLMKRQQVRGMTGTMEVRER